jgi:hypothetical protein
MTSRVTVVVCFVLPLVPVTVMVWSPVEALRPTVIFMVEEPAPVMVVGLNETELALPSPEAESVIGESKPPVVVAVMVTSPDALRAMVMEVGLALMENPAVVPVTVSETVVVSTVLPEVPVTVMG